MFLYVRVSNKADADLIELYKHIHGGLGLLFKSVLLDYFKYYSIKKGEFKFTLPEIKKEQVKDTGNIMVIKIPFNNNEYRAVESIKTLPNGGKSTFIKNLTRMYLGDTLISITRPLFGQSIGEIKNKKSFSETKENKIFNKKEKEVKVNETFKKPIFKPEEF